MKDKELCKKIQEIYDSGLSILDTYGQFKDKFKSFYFFRKFCKENSLWFRSKTESQAIARKKRKHRPQWINKVI
jgi:hypothetical protein